MKHLKPLFTALLLLFCTVVNAHDFEVDGIYYSITNSTKKTVEVTYRGNSYDEYSNEYTGDVTIPETVTYNYVTYSVTSIGDYAFYGCSEIKRFTIPNSVTSIGRYAFEGTAWYNNQPNGLIYAGKVLYKYKGTMPGNYEIVVKDSTLGIAGGAFRGCDGLTSIEIPNSVTSIGMDAFYYCSGLTSIEIPNSVTSIGRYAFYHCSGLTSIEIPNSVTSIGSYAFSSCLGLTSVTIGNSVTSIGDEVFSGCWGLTSITIPNSVTSIGDYAFAACYNLTSIEIPNSVTSIGDEAFIGCWGFKTVINYSNLTFEKGSSGNGYIAYYADNVINAPGGEMTGDFCFFTADGKNYLAGYIGDDTEITLPASYKGESYEIAANAFKQNSSITNVNFTNGVTCIGENAFSGCTALEKIELPNSVTSIGNFAFYSCYGLRKVVVPENITYIGESAFENCTALAEIRSFIPAKRLFVPGDYAFEGVDKDACILYVPQDAKKAYATTAGWRDFANIIDGGNMFAVTYIIDGEVYATDSIAYGDEVVLIDEPVREGHTFSGWSEAPTTMPAEDVTVYGSFTINYYAVTYIVDGEVYLTDSIVYGGEIVLINEPAKEYYTFSGWSEIPATMPAEDVTVYGSFIANSYFLTSIVDGEIERYNLEENKDVDDFAYYRTLPDAKWNSLYVPFDINVEDLANDYDVAYINCVHSYDRDKNGEIDEMEMEVILVLDGVLKANYPYLIRAKDEYVLDIALCLENTTLCAAEENGVTCSSVFTRFDVVGNYTTQPVQETAGCYEVRDGMWQALNPGAELQPFRHYLYITNIDGSPLKENVVRSMSIRVDGEMEDDDETTGIDELQSADNKGSYDLQGRKINDITEKGIYIVNGKKVLVK